MKGAGLPATEKHVARTLEKGSVLGDITLSATFNKGLDYRQSQVSDPRASIRVDSRQSDVT